MTKTTVPPRVITGKIVSVSVAAKSDETAVPAPAAPVTTGPVPLVKLKRAAKVLGPTYKLKSPLTGDASYYVTITYEVVDRGLPTERNRPIDFFINTRDCTHFQWVQALTLLVSAIFHRTEDVRWVAEELKSVFGANNDGYLSREGYIPSLVAEIGAIIEKSFIEYGIIQEDKSHKDYLQSLAAEAGLSTVHSVDSSKGLCPKCNSMGVVNLSGCPTCLICGDSKCG